jgi:uncharacterized protein (TIGR02466 family)
MELLNLFPTKVMIETVPSEIIFSSKDFVIGQDFPEGTHNEEWVGSKTSYDDLYTYEEMSPLVDFINQTFNNYLINFQAGQFQHFRMSGMWANIHSNGFRHQSHVHPNVYYSGVVYLDIPETATNRGTLVFDNPTPAHMHQADDDQNRTYEISPETSKVIIFPSWLRHGTDRFYDPEGNKRVCISFNYVLDYCSINTMKI